MTNGNQTDSGTKVHVFTSAAINYIPKVRLLCNSIRTHHPSWILHLLLADEVPPDFDYSNEPFASITTIDQLGIDHWKGWSFCHSITELATAIKPWMLERLLEESGPDGKVIYFDPDIVVFSPLDDIISALNQASVVLTPHQTSPEETIAAVIDNEICSLKHGIYNLGFVGVSNTSVGRAFARWWSERTYYFCRDDISNGLFTDQRWIDLAPALFPDVAVMRSSRHNVSTWNITTRDLSYDTLNGYKVDGESLGFYHFTGFDSGAHRIMAGKNGKNNPALQQLVSWYSKEIILSESDPLSSHKWAYGMFESGEKIMPEQRIIYRMRRDLQIKFPDPYALSSFDQWWKFRAIKEYPKLFDKSKREIEIQKITTPLTVGFLGSGSYLSGRPSAASLLKNAIRDPQTGIQLARRAWRILQAEGFKGVITRVE